MRTIYLANFLANEEGTYPHTRALEISIDGDTANVEIRLGEIARDTEVVDLCEGSMDNE